MARKYTSISIETTLSSAISSTATSIPVTSVSNLIGNLTITTGDQFTVVIDPDTVNEEIIFVTDANTTTNTLTATRNRVGTSAIAHSAGATVRHVLTSDDLNYFNNAIQSSVAVPGTPTIEGGTP